MELIKEQVNEADAGGGGVVVLHQQDGERLLEWFRAVEDRGPK